MKKKLFVMSLVVVMLMGIVGCGAATPSAPMESDKVSPNPTTDEATTPNETTTPNIDDGIVDEGTLGNVPNVNDTSSIDTWNTDIENGIRWEYGENAWLETYPLLDDTTLARNLTYFKNTNNDSISITWVGPNGVGEWYNLSTDGELLTIMDIDKNYGLMMWNSGVLSSESDFMKNTNVDIILSCWGYGDAIADTYVVVEDSETSYSVLFEVTYDVNGLSYRGYAYFIDYLDRMECYQFVYLMDEPLFNEDEAMMVINSIEYFEGLE